MFSEELDKKASLRPVKYPTLGTILIVEDDEAIRDCLEQMLGDEGYLVRLAANGIEAIASLQNEASLPNLIFLDMLMPLMDGPEFLGIMERKRIWNDVPVVLFSAAKTAPSSKLLVKKLKKPVELDEVLQLASTYARVPNPPIKPSRADS